MDKLISALKKQAKLLLLIFVGAYALFEFLYAVGRMAAGDGGVVAGGIFFIFAFGGLVAALIVALLKKNEQVARFIGLAFFGYLAIRLIYSLMGWAGDSALEKAIFSFDFLATLCGLAIFAMVILGLFVPKFKDNKVITLVSLCLLLAFILFTLLARFLDFGVIAKYNHDYQEYGIKYPWYGVVGTLGSIFMLGVILFGYLLLFVKTPEIVEGEGAEPVQEEDVEVVEEAPANEEVLEAEVVEEAPAEELVAAPVEAEAVAEPTEE